jgi:Na+-driven multidrug efflux pump
LDTLNAPPEVRPIAEIYLQLLAPVMLVEAYNQTMAAILRAHLHVRDSLGVMILMHTSHLILAFVFMHGLGEWEGWGLNGYAAALFISRSLGLGLHLWLWRKRMHLKPQRDDWWNLPVGALTPVLRIGLPGAALELVYRMAFMVSVAATAKLGVQALATHSYTLQLLKFVLLISLSIGWACEIMVGRLIGSGRLREAHELVQKGLRNGLLASGLMALLAAIFAPWLMKAFTRDPAIIAAAQTLLWLSLALETGRVFNLVVIGALRATGDVNFPVLASMGSLILVLGVGSYFMGQAYGLPGIWVVYAAEEWIRGLVMQTRWQLGGWIKHARNTQRGLRILG